MEKIANSVKRSWKKHDNFMKESSEKSEFQKRSQKNASFMYELQKKCKFRQGFMEKKFESCQRITERMQFSSKKCKFDQIITNKM